MAGAELDDAGLLKVALESTTDEELDHIDGQMQSAISQKRMDSGRRLGSGNHTDEFKIRFRVCHPSSNERMRGGKREGLWK